MCIIRSACKLSCVVQSYEAKLDRFRTQKEVNFTTAWHMFKHVFIVYACTCECVYRSLHVYICSLLQELKSKIEEIDDLHEQKKVIKLILYDIIYI